MNPSLLRDDRGISLALGEYSERRIARMHARRREEIHRFCFPLLIILLFCALAFAAMIVFS